MPRGWSPSRKAPCSWRSTRKTTSTRSTRPRCSSSQLRTTSSNPRRGLEAAQANVLKADAGVTQANAAVAQATAAVANARAALTKAKALDDLAKTEEQIAVGLQKVDAGAISDLKVAKAVQNRQAMDAGVKQARPESVRQLQPKHRPTPGLAVAQSTQQQAEAAERQSSFALQMAKSNVNAARPSWMVRNSTWTSARCTPRPTATS